jgi:parallel beta-helix repeat protein
VERSRTLFSILVGAALAVGLLFAGSAGANRPLPPVKLPPHVIGDANPACGATLSVNTTLSGDLDCSGYAGIALTLDAGVTLNLGHHTLTVHSGWTGVYSDADKATVTGGEISGGDEQVYFWESSHDTASSLTLTGGEQGGVYMEYETAAKITSNTISGASEEGMYMAYSASDLVQGNTITNATQDGIETYEDAHDEFTLNHVTNSGDNYYDGSSDLDEFIGNTSTGGTYGFHLYEDGYGAVVAKNNVESGASDDGFYLADDYNSEAYAAPYTLISGNKASDNGEIGFEDEASYNATYTGNSATGNTEYGFYLDYPGRDTITGNSATGNTLAGFYLEDNYEYYQVLKFSTNTAKNNGDYGFHAEYGAPGKGNVGSGNVPADCYDVVCGAGVTTTPKPLAPPVNDPSAPPPPPGS